MPVHTKASARGQLPPRDDDEDDNAVTRFQRRSDARGLPIAQRIADASRPRNPSIDDEAMTVLLDRASVLPLLARTARSPRPPEPPRDVPRARERPTAPTAPPPPPYDPAADVPTQIAPRSLPPPPPSIPAPAVTISRPPPPVARAAVSPTQARGRGIAPRQIILALAVLVVGGSLGAAITSIVARRAATISADRSPEPPPRAADLAGAAAQAPVACAAGDLAATSAAAERSDPVATATTAPAHRSHRTSAEAGAAHRAAVATLAAAIAADAGLTEEGLSPDDLAAAADALSKAKLETTLP